MEFNSCMYVLSRRMIPQHQIKSCNIDSRTYLQFGYTNRIAQLLQQKKGSKTDFRVVRKTLIWSIINKWSLKRSQFESIELKVRERSTNLSKATECTINSSKYCGEDGIPNLGIHKIDLKRFMYKNLLYTGPRNNKQEVSKQYKTYKDNWSPECNHNTDIILCCTANNYMMNNILRNKITSNTKIAFDTLPRGKNSCHWKVVICTLMMAFVGPTKGLIWKGKRTLEQTNELNSSTNLHTGNCSQIYSQKVRLTKTFFPRRGLGYPTSVFPLYHLLFHDLCTTRLQVRATIKVQCA